MEVTRIPLASGEAVYIQPPRIESWKTAYGINRQQVAVGENVLEISYLMGAAVGKNGCGDAGLIMAAAVPEALAIVSETDDYLSPPANDPDWARVRNKYDLKWLVPGIQADDKFPVRWERPDIAGVDLQRKFVQSESAIDYVQYVIGSLGGAVGQNVGIEWRNQMYFPVLEKIADLISMEYLIERNKYRWRVIRELVNNINKVKEIWRNYWLNSAIAVLGLVVDTRKGSNGYSDHMFNAGDSWTVSNADVMQFRGFMGNHLDDYTISMPSENLRGLPINGDINNAFDAMAKARGVATEQGLVGDTDYHNKTAPDGIYMTWGPEVYKNMGWMSWALPRSFHYTSSYQDPGYKDIICQTTDGSVNTNRDPNRDSSVARNIYSKRSWTLTHEGYISLAKEVLGTDGATDDFYMCLINIIRGGNIK